MTLADGMKIPTLYNQYGSNRENAERPAKELDGCEFVGVIFAGGLCETPDPKERKDDNEQGNKEKETLRSADVGP